MQIRWKRTHFQGKCTHIHRENVYIFIGNPCIFLGNVHIFLKMQENARISLLNERPLPARVTVSFPSFYHLVIFLPNIWNEAHKLLQIFIVANGYLRYTLLQLITVQATGYTE